MNNQNPIGIFDSGLGGLTVVKAMRKVMPNESILYFGDTARVPYGNKSPDLIKEYSKQITEFLLEHDTKIIVVACNTATALALNYLEARFEIPLIGVVQPGVNAAIRTTKNNRIGVIGTIATISSNVYENKIVSSNNNIKVTSTPCPLFVPLVEEGWVDGPATKLIAQKYLESIKSAGVDTLILGCTHYPLLTQIIQEVVTNRTILVDSAKAIANETANMLKEKKLNNNQQNIGTLKMFVSDLPARFETVASRFLGEKIADVKKIQLDKI